MEQPWSAIVLAGGRGTRLDGADKASIEVGARTLLARSLDALADAAEVVVVGDPVPTERPVTFVRESPAYGGPAAALLTGLDALLAPAAYVAVAAVDMPYLSGGTWRRLVDAAAGRDGSALVGPDGRRQLAVVVATAPLLRARPDHERQHDLPLWRLLSSLSLVEVVAVGGEHRDIDTWADLRDAD